MTSYQKAILLTTGSSVLVPVVGLATAPILAQALGVAGRGEAGAAMAPNLLIVGVAAFGLPQALTYHLARRPDLTASALWWSTAVGVLFGGLSVLAFLPWRNYLAAGTANLASLMVLGAWLAIPTLWVGLLRGAAMGRQRWTAVALEKAFTSVLRLVLLGALALSGWLDVFSAVLVLCLTPIVAGIAYVGLAASREQPFEAGPPVRVGRELLSYGSRIWLGTIAFALLGRSSQLLVLPLSDAAQLGLFLVAITIADVPYLLTLTVCDVAFSTNSAQSNTPRLLRTSRVATLIATTICVIVGATLPLWIGVLFGRDFEAALVPSWLLLVSSCIAVPGLVAGAGLTSSDRPGRRSISMVVGLVVNTTGLVVLVPGQGAVGAAYAALITGITMTTYTVLMASRTLGCRWFQFVAVNPADLRLLMSLPHSVAHRLFSERSR